MNDVTQRLIDFVAELSKSDTPIAITGDTPIFEDGHLDSLGFMKLILFVEELRGHPIPEEALDLASFATINTMVSSYL